MRGAALVLAIGVDLAGFAFLTGPEPALPKNNARHDSPTPYPAAALPERIRRHAIYPAPQAPWAASPARATPGPLPPLRATPDPERRP